MELTINGAVYQFTFGMGFLREINKRIAKPVDGIPDAKQNIGLQYYVAGIADNDPEALVEVLFAANGGQNPRVTRAALDAYIDDESTDIDGLFKDTLDFLSSANATKKAVKSLLQAIEEQRAKNAQA